jgi:ketosteroid isomerase-like protein
MDGIEGYASHPARDMAVRSMTAIEAGDRDAWLALFADDGIVEDPIGPSMFDRDGKGHRGKEAVAAFYDTTISSGRVRFAIRESYAAGSECANVGTITTTLPDGTRAVVDGVFTYRLADNGRIAALRAFWETDNVRLEPPE